MILCDTGPLVALIDADDPHHSRCVAALEHFPPGQFVTTWPCWAEAMYLLYRAAGLPGQEELWDYLDNGLVILETPRTEEWQRMRALMRQYRDAPMDLADASLVAVAERLDISSIFTLDRHFHAYRIAGQHPFVVFP